METYIVEYIDEKKEGGIIEKPNDYLIDWYPNEISTIYVHPEELPRTNPWYIGTIIPEIYLSEEIKEIVGSHDVYWLIIIKDSQGRYPAYQPYAMYYLSKGKYIRLNYFIEEKPDYDYTDLLEGEGVYWLASVGQLVIKYANKFEDIINFKINGYSFLTLVSTTGFLLYMGWTIVKWIIPI